MRTIKWKSRTNRRASQNVTCEDFTDSSSVVFDISWTHTNSLSSWPPSDAGSQLSALTRESLSDLAGRGVCIRGEGKLFPSGRKIQLTIPPLARIPVPPRSLEWGGELPHSNRACARVDDASPRHGHDRGATVGDDANVHENPQIHLLHVRVHDVDQGGCGYDHEPSLDAYAYDDGVPAEEIPPREP